MVDFGLRRAQGLGGISASKASIIGGVTSTSNVMAASMYNLATAGTQAHSWVQIFPSEYEAFQKFAEFYPDQCVLLVDTYNTLRSGVPNAIKTAKQLEERGKKLIGVRIDSGDLAYLSKKTREMLDQADLSYVQIFTSNQLDEYVIRSLLEQGAPIDAFGVGTRLVTGYDQPALDGVYKLAVIDEADSLKISDNVAKTTLPGLKKCIRFLDRDNMFYADGIFLESEDQFDFMIHPVFPDKMLDLSKLNSENLFREVLRGGEPLTDPLAVAEAAAYSQRRFSQLAVEHKRFEYPHTYKVGISRQLSERRNRLVQELQSHYQGESP